MGANKAEWFCSANGTKRQTFSYQPVLDVELHLDVVDIAICQVQAAGHDGVLQRNVRLLELQEDVTVKQTDVEPILQTQTYDTRVLVE